MKKTEPETALVVPTRTMALIFAVAILVRLTIMVGLQTWEFDDERAFGYEMGRLGQSLAQGNGFVLTDSPTAAFPPFYPLVVAGLFSIFGIYSQASAIAIFLFQSICAGLTAVLLVLIGTRLWSFRIGLIAGIVWVFYPTSIFYSVIRVWYCELAITLVLVAALVAITAPSPLTFSRVALLGALSGVSILTDPTTAIYLALLPLWVLFTQRAKFQRTIALIPVWGIVFGVVVSPWAIHNWVFLGSPTIVKSNFGREFFTGNFPGRGFNAALADQQPTRLRFDQEQATRYKKQSEILYNRYLLVSVAEWILTNPADFASRTARRIGHFWWVNPHLGRNSWVRLTYYGPLVLLAIYGLWFVISRRWHSAPVWLFLLVYPLPYYLTHVANGRYTYPVEPFIALLAAVPLALCFDRNWALAKRKAPAIAPASILSR